MDNVSFALLCRDSGEYALTLAGSALTDSNKAPLVEYWWRATGGTRGRRTKFKARKTIVSAHAIR